MKRPIIVAALHFGYDGSGIDWSWKNPCLALPLHLLSFFCFSILQLTEFIQDAGESSLAAFQ